MKRLVSSTEIQTLNGLEELRQFVGIFLDQISQRQIILLRGELGAGKTQLVREILAQLGSDEVSSPSFAIHNRYPTAQITVDHLDLYRLKDEDDLESTGFWELFDQDKGLIIVEWPDRLNYDELPLYWQLTEIEIVAQPSGTRLLTLKRY